MWQKSQAQRQLWLVPIMMNQLSLFRSKCSETELRIIRPLEKLFRLHERSFEYSPKSNTVILNFDDAAGNYCPFEIAFSRDEGNSYFSFYAGCGVEVACYEKIGQSNECDDTLSHGRVYFVTNSLFSDKSPSLTSKMPLLYLVKW